MGNLQRRGHLHRRRSEVSGEEGVRGGLRSEGVILARCRADLVPLLVSAAALAVVSPLVPPLEAVVVVGAVVLLRRRGGHFQRGHRPAGVALPRRKRNVGVRIVRARRVRRRAPFIGKGLVGVVLRVVPLLGVDARGFSAAVELLQDPLRGAELASERALLLLQFLHHFLRPHLVPRQLEVLVAELGHQLVVVVHLDLGLLQLPRPPPQLLLGGPQLPLEPRRLLRLPLEVRHRLLELLGRVLLAGEVVVGLAEPGAQVVADPAEAPHRGRRREDEVGAALQAVLHVLRRSRESETLRMGVIFPGSPCKPPESTSDRR